MAEKSEGTPKKEPSDEIDKRIMGLLREQELRKVTGMAKIIGVNRSTISRHLQYLKREGYVIDVPMKGYIAWKLVEKETEESELPTFEELLNYCQLQVAKEISYLKGTAKNEQDRKSKKYLHDLYVIRKEIEKEFANFLEQDEKNCYMVIGEAGIGKTNLLCHLGENYGMETPVVFYNAQRIKIPIEEWIGKDLSERFGLREKSSRWVLKIGSLVEFYNVQRIKIPIEEWIGKDLSEIFGLGKNSFRWVLKIVNDVLIKNNTELIVFIDAINESSKPKKLKQELADMVHETSGMNVKFCLSCRDIDWEFFKRNNDVLLNNIYSGDWGRLEGKGGFNEFTEREFSIAYKKYMKWYNLTLPEEEMTKKRKFPKVVKKICKHPLMLRFLAEGFEGSEIPQTTRRVEIFNQYWEKKLENTAAITKAKEYMFKIVAEMKDGAAFGKKYRTDLYLIEVCNLLNESIDNIQSILSKILSENLVTYLNREGERVVGFTYESFFEYVMAKWILYGVEGYSWYKNDENKILKDFNNFVYDAKHYRTIKGVIFYLILMMEEEPNDIHIKLLEIISEGDNEWKEIVITAIFTLKNPEKAQILIENLLFNSKLDKWRKIKLIYKLGEDGGEKAINILSNAFIIDDKDLREAVGNSLVKIGTKAAAKAFLKALKHNHKFVRLHAIQFLGKFDPEKAMKPLNFALVDSNVYVKKEAIRTLGKFCTEEAVNSLTLPLKDGDIDIRLEVVKVLKNISINVGISNDVISSQKVYPSDNIIELLNLALKDQSLFVRREAIEAFQKYTRFRGDNIEKIKKDITQVLKDEDDIVRSIAVNTIEEIKSRQKYKKIK